MNPLEITSSFSLPNAGACAEASALTYTNLCSLVTNLAHAQIFHCGNAALVAFRGSQSLRDWLTDLDCLRIEIGSNEEIHHGFLNASIGANYALQNFLRPHLNAPIFITGHSLGAAMAVLAARALKAAGHQVTAVYTFGGPRIGNAAFANHYDAALGANTFRIVNEEDIVPRLPGCLMGYRHVGQLAFLPSLGGLRLNPPLWFRLISDAVGTYLDWKRGRLAQLADHPISQYLSKIPPMPTLANN
jgi:predicted lipase